MEELFFMIELFTLKKSMEYKKNSMQNVLQHWISFSDLNPPLARQNQKV